MIEWFNRLASREQSILVGGATLALLVVGWSFVWSPLRESTLELDRAVAEKSRLVVDLQRAADLGGAAGSSASAPSQSMMILVDQTAQSIGLAGTFTRRQNDGPDAYSISFSDAPFHTIVRWLIEIERTHGVRVESANVSRAREPGLVDGQIVLDRS
jgi:type II secretory pathway component PulM